MLVCKILHFYRKKKDCWLSLVIFVLVLSCKYRAEVSRSLGVLEAA